MSFSGITRQALRSALVETSHVQLSWSQKTQLHSPEDTASIPVLERTWVILNLLSREDKKNFPFFNFDSPGGVTAAHHTCEHMGIR